MSVYVGPTRVFFDLSGSRRKRLTNAGPDILYYGDQTVTTGAFTGQVAVGAAHDIPGAVWLVSAGQSRVEYREDTRPERTVWTENVLSYGATGDGLTDDTAAVQKAINAAGANGVVYFPNPPGGEYFFQNITFQPGQSIIGESALCAFRSFGQPLMTLQGNTPPNTLSDLGTIRNFRAVCDVDMPYGTPLIKIVGRRNFIIEQVDCGMTGTGTFIQTDDCYLYTVRNCMWRTGRYAVPFEWTNASSLDEQYDTIRFDDVTIVGTHGSIFRREVGSSSDLHGVAFEGFKHVVTLDKVNGVDDWAKYAESTLTANASVGATSVTLRRCGTGTLVGTQVAGATSLVLNTGQGAGFQAGDLITVDTGDNLERLDVQSVTGDTLVLDVNAPTAVTHTAGATVGPHVFANSDPILLCGQAMVTEVAKVHPTTPITTASGTVTLPLTAGLRYAHTTGESAVAHGFCVVLPDNTFNVVARRCHWEKSAVGAVLHGGQGFVFDANFNGCGEFVRTYGSTQNLTIRETTMGGQRLTSVQHTGQGVVDSPPDPRNTLLRVPYNLPGTLSQFRLEGVFPAPSGAPPVVLKTDPGNNLTGVEKVVRYRSGTVRELRSASSSTNTRLYSTGVDDAERWGVDSQGRHWFTTAGAAYPATSVARTGDGAIQVALRDNAGAVSGQTVTLTGGATATITFGGTDTIRQSATADMRTTGRWLATGGLVNQTKAGVPVDGDYGTGTPTATAGQMVLDTTDNRQYHRAIGSWLYSPLIGTPPTITGSRGGNVALASLLTALATAGYIIDGSV